MSATLARGSLIFSFSFALFVGVCVFFSALNSIKLKGICHSVNSWGLEINSRLVYFLSLPLSLFLFLFVCSFPLLNMYYPVGMLRFLHGLYFFRSFLCLYKNSCCTFMDAILLPFSSNTFLPLGVFCLATLFALYRFEFFFFFCWNVRPRNQLIRFYSIFFLNLTPNGLKTNSIEVWWKMHNNERALFHRLENELNENNMCNWKLDICTPEHSNNWWSFCVETKCSFHLIVPSLLVHVFHMTKLQLNATTNCSLNNY